MEATLDKNDFISNLCLMKKCSYEIARVCLEASGYNFDVASSIYDSSSHFLQNKKLKVF